MKSFEGQFASRKKVDLRGRSRVEESREQVSNIATLCFLLPIACQAYNTCATYHSSYVNTLQWQCLFLIWEWPCFMRCPASQY